MTCPVCLQDEHPDCGRLDACAECLSYERLLALSQMSLFP